jgi:hypothetical protein
LRLVRFNACGFLMATRPAFDAGNKTVYYSYGRDPALAYSYPISDVRAAAVGLG